MACDGKMFAVHKLVLSSCSDYFFTILQSIECPKPVIVLKDISSNDFEALLSYMYLGEVNVLQDNLPSLLEASESLGVKGLGISDDNELKNINKIRDKKFKVKNKTSSGMDSSANIENSTPEAIQNDYLATDNNQIENSGNHNKRKLFHEETANDITNLSTNEAIDDIENESSSKKAKVSLSNSDENITDLAFTDSAVEVDIDFYEPTYDSMVR